MTSDPQLNALIERELANYWMAGLKMDLVIIACLVTLVLVFRWLDQAR